jgi:transcriptional regulator with XRE-family HTH domain
MMIGEPLTEPFAHKLTLALKALSISRTRLAADMGVDKSVVARWASGATRPSAHNLAVLSASVARMRPGFSALDWDRDLEDLARRLGVDPGPQVAGDAAGLPLTLLEQARATTALRGRTYEGFYRSTRPYPQVPGRYVHDEVRVRLSGGLLSLRMFTGGVPVDGWVLPLGAQLFVIGGEMTSGSMVFAVLHGLAGVSVRVLDGLTLFSSLDVGRTPTATPLILTRTGELSDDPVADDARLTQLGRGDPLAPQGSVSEEIRRHLDRDIGGDWVLSLPLALSMARGD